MLLPEKRNIFICALIAELFYICNNGEFVLVYYFVIHSIASLKRKFDFQRSKGFEHDGVLTHGNRRYAVKPCERLCKAVRRIISVL